jgi:predicted flap endonuclease-1-like 5' DNA nuclease
LGLFLQIVVFLIVAAALGFAVGWLVRGAKFQSESDRLAGDWRARLGRVEDERDRLQAELAAARDDRVALEGVQSEAGQRSAAGDPDLEARTTRLERELEQTRAANARQRAEIERLEARTAELQANAAHAPAAPAPAAPTPAASTAAAGTIGAPPIAAPAAVEQVSAEAQASPPPALTRPEGEPDDLKRISGIGPGIEKTLHELGIFHYRQIAAFTPENVAWIDRRLRFKGRIERENWIGQARRLAAES